MLVSDKPTARIVHLTSVHPRYDVRILGKECESLAQAQYDVHLVVADSKGPETRRGVSIHDVGGVRGRLRRFALLPFRVWKAARKLRADVYHFHDPELVPVGLLLHWAGHKVIYDSHENVPGTILSKYWIRPSLRGVIAKVVGAIEDFAARRFSGIVAATPRIAERFSPLNARTVTVNNYPLKSEVDAIVPPSGDGRTVCYIGAISRHRCVVEMVQALEHVDVQLILAGEFENQEVKDHVMALPGWQRVDYRGIVDRKESKEIMAKSFAGLCFMYPEPNHVESQPVKMYEYMMAGLPVLASDFPLWKQLIETTRAGLVSDPMVPEKIAEAIRRVMQDPAAAQAMGRAGRQAVIDRYQWSFEEATLVRLYEHVLN